jgi:predicted nucleotidyltransferase
MMDQAIECLIEKANRDDAVLAVVLFGSHARGEATHSSDVDLCLVLSPEKDNNDARSMVRMAYLDQGDIDVHIFQQLPLYIRRRVLKEGKVLACKDLDTLYAIAYRTAREFDDFRPFYQCYLDQVVRAGS